MAYIFCPGLASGLLQSLFEWMGDRIIGRNLSFAIFMALFLLIRQVPYVLALAQRTLFHLMFTRPMILSIFESIDEQIECPSDWRGIGVESRDACESWISFQFRLPLGNTFDSEYCHQQ